MELAVHKAHKLVVCCRTYIKPNLQTYCNLQQIQWNTGH